jgi:hypothetical protein
MPTFYPFRIEIEFVDRTEYTPSRMKEDGWAFCQQLERSLQSQDSSEKDGTSSVVFINSRTGSLVHWGYIALERFALGGFIGDIGTATTLAELLRDVIDVHYQKKIAYFDARIGNPYSEENVSIAELKNRFQPFWTHKIGTMGQRSEWPSQRLDQGCLQLDDAPKNANSLQAQFERNKILQNWQRDRVIFPWIIVLGLLIFIGFSRWLPASGRGSESAEHIEPAHEFCENCGCLNCCSQGASGNLELLEVHRGLVNLESTVRELTSQLEDNRPAIAEKSQAPEVEVFGGSKIVRPIK